MLTFFFIVLLVPAVIIAIDFIALKSFTWKEAGCQFVAQLLVATCACAIVSCEATSDVEALNGRVTGKQSQHVSCSHSYSCHCHDVCSGSGRKRSCHEECDTCYEHSYDVDWNVDTSVGQTITVDRVDRQGTSEPPRWSAVVVGEPVSVPHSYENFVKASPGTLFKRQGLTERFQATLPDYPQRFYDYYRLDHLLTVGIAVDDPRRWNEALARLNADLGAPKQANIVVVIVNDQPHDWYYALEEKWVGGKKNDVIVVIGVNGGMAPQWAAVMCWTTNELFKVKLRDDVMNDGALSLDTLVADLRTNVSQSFVRKPMHDFEYLQAEMTPTPAEWALTLFVALVVALGLTWFFKEVKPFDNACQPKRYPRSPYMSSRY